MTTSHPLEIAYNRLDEAHRAWHGALDGYHKIEDFRANVNTAVQALRNTTFALQKQKDSLLGFDTWYISWREKMKADAILRELYEARNIIVKQEDLKLHSVATARTKGWVDFERMAFSFDPTKDSLEVAQGFYNTYARYLPIAEEIKKRLLFEFERKWVYERLPDHELLGAISHAYNFLYELLQDAEKQFSLKGRGVPVGCSYCSCEINEAGKLKCMILTQQERCLTFSFKEGEILKLQTSSINRKEDHLKDVQKRYGDEWKSEGTLTLIEGLFPKEYPFNQMKLFAQVAISNLKKDKYLVPMSFVFKEKSKDVPIIIAHPFQNQEQKVMTMDTVANAVIKNNGKFVRALMRSGTTRLTKRSPLSLQKIIQVELRSFFSFRAYPKIK